MGGRGAVWHRRGRRVKSIVEQAARPGDETSERGTDLGTADRCTSQPLERIRLLALYVSIASDGGYFARPTPSAWPSDPSSSPPARGSVLGSRAPGQDAELVTSGPYRFTRNPMYLGRLLIFIGLCVMARLPYHLNWVALVAGWLVFFGYYLPRKERIEPARLKAVHGDAYQCYTGRCRPCSDLAPSPYPEGASSGWSSDRMVRNREHWMFSGLTLVTLFLLWRRRSGRSGRPDLAGPVLRGPSRPSRLEKR